MANVEINAIADFDGFKPPFFLNKPSIGEKITI